MDPRPFLCLAVLAACAAQQSPSTPAAAAAPATATAAAPPTQDARMQWWREARFGMFIHWGLYAIPAGEWQGQKNYGEWIRDSAKIPVGTYDRFQPQWNPTAFDADAWAKMAAAAGMKYLVLTSKHHDGFCLFDSKQTEWDVMNTPHGRDICRELAAACARHDVVFCTYHSIMDWHHPDYLPRRPWEAATRSADGADFAKFEAYLHQQVTEVITRYQPAVMWFDGEWESTWNHQRGVRLFELCRKLAPAMIVNNRVDVHRGGMGGFNGSQEAVGDFATPEQEIPATGVPGVDWESCMTMNRHWGWNAADTQWKSTDVLLRNLIDIASKGGNYLLNVGPRADGSFPPQAVERLEQIAAWMAVHGEAIHGTTASVFDSLPFGRCTVKRGAKTTTLYLHVLDWPDSGKLVLPGLGNQITQASLMPATTPLPCRRVGVDWEIELPAMFVKPTQPSVVKVELPGAPVVFRAPVVQAETEQFVATLAVTCDAGTPDVAVHYTLDGSEPGATAAMAKGPLQLSATTTVKARSFHQGQPVSAVTSRTFTKVTPTPANDLPTTAQGLRCTTFPGIDWQRIPADFMVPADAKSPPVPTVSCGPKPGEKVAKCFDGFVVVPADDVYRFALRSDDGSKLWLDGQELIDNDGPHGPTEVLGVKALAKGQHTLRVVWWNATGGADLALFWARPGQPFTPVPESAFRH